MKVTLVNEHYYARNIIWLTSKASGQSPNLLWTWSATDLPRSGPHTIDDFSKFNYYISRLFEANMAPKTHIRLFSFKYLIVIICLFPLIFFPAKYETQKSWIASVGELEKAVFKDQVSCILHLFITNWFCFNFYIC